MTALKAYVAVLFMVITSITSTNVIPATGGWHVFWVVLSIMVGALATYYAPNKPSTTSDSQANK